MSTAFEIAKAPYCDSLIATCLNCGHKMVIPCPELSRGHKCRPMTIVRQKAKNPAAEQRGGGTVVCRTGFVPFGNELPAIASPPALLT